MKENEDEINIFYLGNNKTKIDIFKLSDKKFENFNFFKSLSKRNVDIYHNN